MNVSVFAGALLFLTACSAPVVQVAPGPESAPWPWPISETVADSVRTEVLAPGVRLHQLVQLERPWRAAVLDVDLAQCVSVQSVKGAPNAVGRFTTSELLRGLGGTRGAVGAVNADFFLFAPPGVPTGAQIERGRLLAGPGPRPVFALDSAGRPYIGTFRASGTVRVRDTAYTLSGWNRPSATSLSVIDGAWGVPVDTAVLGSVWRLRSLGGTRYVVDGTIAGAATADAAAAVATAAAAATTALPLGDDVLLVRGRDTPGAVLLLAHGDSLDVSWMLEPFYPRDAVGGFPVLLRDSAMPPGAATAGAAGFSGPNPRTAVGIAAGGRRLLLVVIDGRQPGFSAGATLEQTANLLRALGAPQAINLDGGGSSALVVRNTQGELRLVTRPSDPSGERAVGNALAVLQACDGNRSATR